ncbi:MAG: hypothetical protein FD138_4359 [Planctomycetota bacterium]|nr:MAG: hypothetical protein FD138_4359 [Planctomycetota bacterium]
MTRLPIRALLLLLLLVVGRAWSDEPLAKSDQEEQNIEAAFTMTRDAAKMYEFESDNVKQPAVLREQPILRWSNPERGQVYGNVFLWTKRGRPAVVGSLFKWFSPFTHMSHEFHSLSVGEIVGEYDSREVWRSAQPGVTFAPIPDAPAVAATPAARLTQMRQLARQFTARSVDREGLKSELRQLTQPVYRYELDKDSAELLDGALFVFVQGTDPDAWLLLEAFKSADQSAPKWQFAVARMNSIEITVEHNGRRAWHCDSLPFRDVVTSHKLPYTSFKIDKP